MKQSTALIDSLTGKTYPIDEPCWQSPDGASLLVTELPGIRRTDINTAERSIWRYSKAMPVHIEKPISLGEGCTPLIDTSYAGLQCKFKLEWFSPTGSFKDRGTSVMLSLLQQQGISNVIEDSSGNGGASVAAYGAAAGMKTTILVPAYTQAAKIAQIRAYGAEVILVPGPREATESKAFEMASEVFYASHNWHPFFIQGTKTLGYEIWEDLNYELPDNVVIPGSAGSNVIGIYTAFRELMNSGETDRMPKIFVSQPANCSPLHNALHENKSGDEKFEFLPTVAEGTAIKNPIRLDKMVDIINETGGGTVTLTEEEIIVASLKLAKKGLYVEPTCAHAAAGFKKLMETKTISPKEETVVILTGTGLKSTFFYADQFESNNEDV